MQGSDNAADATWDNGWALVGQRVDTKSGRFEVAWQREGDDQPSRWCTTNQGMKGIRLADGSEEIWLLLPAEVRSLQQVEERANGKVWRTSTHEVTIQLVRDVDLHGTQRVVVDAVAVRRAGKVGVTAGALRFNLGELVDWALTREPIATRVRGGSRHVGAGHPLAAEALRASRRKTGKRGTYRVDPAEVARVAAAAPHRGQGRALADAFPGVPRSTLSRALTEARAADPSLHSERSKKAARR